VTDTIQQNRYDQLIRRVAGIVGPGSKVSNAIGDLFPMIDVENVPGELLALMGTRLAWMGTNQPAFAGLVNITQLFNPADSGHLITVTRIDVASQSTQLIVMGLVTVEQTALGGEQFRDGRFELATPPVGQVRIGTQVAPGPVNWQFLVGAFNPHIVQEDNGICVLPPGVGLQITTANQNTSLFTGYLWRERPAEQSELNL